MTLMDATPRALDARPCWFVGAAYGGTSDQTNRFLAEGVWENGYVDKYVDLVRSIQPGDRIAIKSSYTRKHDLPFDNRGHTVSVLAIKAYGKVVENLGDGRALKVEWTPVSPPREWYFYTNRSTVWRVLPGEWTNDALIDFTFNGAKQDLTRFRNAPFWRERFSDSNETVRFRWTSFYEAVADRLLELRHNRPALVTAIHDIAARVAGLSNLQDNFKDGRSGPLEDICPFTAMGIFNRGTTDANRKKIAKAFAEFLGVAEAVPASFDAIPILNNQRSWFFASEISRQPDDIDALWDVFENAIKFANSNDLEDAATKLAFSGSYDNASAREGVGWNLTMGLYWARPWFFPTLDSQSRRYIGKKLQVDIGLHGPKGRCTSADYLSLMDELSARFQEEAYPVHSFPELSLAAWLFKEGPPSSPLGAGGTGGDKDEIEAGEEEPVRPPIEPYSVADIVADGCFLNLARIETILDRLRMKKNLILQGPPGTGKTWLARRLAFALMGQRDDGRIRDVQFHPNLSYEDFVRGWRPLGDGKLALVDGPFLRMIEAAKKDPTSKYVFVIEEINRGNPAQIFGEMLTLMETDKRTPSEALELCYQRNDDERVFIPANLFIIGTMNIADRSLALVDLALRRRFAFVDLEPELGPSWRDWVQKKFGLELQLLDDIEQRIASLNEVIAADPSLGRQFRIGHSYVTPATGTVIGDGREWFRQVVETEIGPLLNEYWFDAPQEAEKAREKLLLGF